MLAALTGHGHGLLARAYIAAGTAALLLGSEPGGQAGQLAGTWVVLAGGRCCVSKHLFFCLKLLGFVCAQGPMGMCCNFPHIIKFAVS